MKKNKMLLGALFLALAGGAIAYVGYRNREALGNHAGGNRVVLLTKYRPRSAVGYKWPTP